MRVYVYSSIHLTIMAYLMKISQRKGIFYSNESNLRNMSFSNRGISFISLIYTVESS